MTSPPRPATWTHAKPLKGPQERFLAFVALRLTCDNALVSTPSLGRSGAKNVARDFSTRLREAKALKWLRDGKGRQAHTLTKGFRPAIRNRSPVGVRNAKQT